jgi:hypothetical protein
MRTWKDEIIGMAEAMRWASDNRLDLSACALRQLLKGYSGLLKDLVMRQERKESRILEEYANNAGEEY